MLNVNLIETMKSGFKNFPDVAKNDFVVDQLDYLQAKEDNLELQPEDHKLAQELVEVAEEVHTKLMEQYRDIWSDPFKK